MQKMHEYSRLSLDGQPKPDLFSEFLGVKLMKS
jgi:hypothetical protein